MGATKFIRYKSLSGLEMEITNKWWDRAFKLLDRKKIKYTEDYTGETNTAKSKDVNVVIKFQDDENLKKAMEYFKKQL